MTNMIPVTYGYVRVSKIGHTTQNPKTQLHILQEFRIRGNHVFGCNVTGSSVCRPSRCRANIERRTTTSSQSCLELKG